MDKNFGTQKKQPSKYFEIKNQKITKIKKQTQGATNEFNKFI